MARRRYQLGTLRKRGKRDPKWELQWREDYIKPDGGIGRRLVMHLLGRVEDMTRRQALKAAQELLRPLNQGKQTPQATLSLQEFVDGYFIPQAFPALKPSTQDRYRRTLTVHLLPVFGSRRLCDLRTLEIQTFLFRKIEYGWGWESASHARNLISKLYATAQDWGFYTGDNPARRVKLPEKTPVREKPILLPHQIPGLLSQLPDPCRTMVQLGLETGLRIGEILALRWRDMDFSSGVIRIERSYYRGSFGTPKTQSSRRTLPMSENLKESLLRYPMAAGGKQAESLVFQTRTGKPLNDGNLRKRMLQPAGRKMGLPGIGWHTLRRTHATLLQAAGGSLKDAQAQLGHAKMSTTLELYTQTIPAQRRAAVEKLSVLMANDGQFDKNPEARPTQWPHHHGLAW